MNMTSVLANAVAISWSNEQVNVMKTHTYIWTLLCVCVFAKIYVKFTDSRNNHWLYHIFVYVCKLIKWYSRLMNIETEFYTYVCALYTQCQRKLSGRAASAWKVTTAPYFLYAHIYLHIYTYLYIFVYVCMCW